MHDFSSVSMPPHITHSHNNSARDSASSILDRYSPVEDLKEKHDRYSSVLTGLSSQAKEPDVRQFVRQAVVPVCIKIVSN